MPTSTLESATEAAPRPALLDLWRRFRRNRAALFGLVVIGGLVLAALLAGVLATHDPFKVSQEPFQPPGGRYFMGTDNLGRDLWSGVVYGARVSLLVGFLAALTATAIGVTVGAVAGFYGGRIDAVLMRLTELFQILPRFFLALVIVALFGHGIEKVILVIGGLSWPPAARLIRAEFLSLKNREFVEAARALGLSDFIIGFRHILPNAIPPAIVTGSLDVAQAILLEASLSFFGLGDPNFVSWGGMLNVAQPFLRRAWWMSVFPGMAIFLAVLAFNLFGDGVNDALNPRLKERTA
jgi:peptide/nickel transport system permease protein